VSARDELAELIGSKLDRLFGSREFGPAKQDFDLADELISAGYSKPRTITTVEELDALPAKSVILGRAGMPLVSDGDKVEPWASVCEDPYGGPIWKNSADIALPATVIYSPEES